MKITLSELKQIIKQEVKRSKRILKEIRVESILSAQEAVATRGNFDIKNEKLKKYYAILIQPFHSHENSRVIEPYYFDQGTGNLYIRGPQKGSLYKGNITDIYNFYDHLKYVYFLLSFNINRNFENFYSRATEAKYEDISAELEMAISTANMLKEKVERFNFSGVKNEYLKNFLIEIESLNTYINAFPQNIMQNNIRFSNESYKGFLHLVDKLNQIRHLRTVLIRYIGNGNEAELQNLCLYNLTRAGHHVS